MKIASLLFCIALSTPCCAGADEGESGEPAAAADGRPGNVHVAGESVRVPIPTSWTGWRAVDVGGKEITRSASSSGLAELGELPIGYFEVLENDGSGKVTAAVVAKTTPAERTPIALDAAIKRSVETAL